MIFSRTERMRSTIQNARKTLTFEMPEFIQN